MKALFKLRKDLGNHFRTDISLTIHLFNALIKPILLYGSEVWGVDIKDNLNNDPAEMVHTKFCKMLLGVNKRASNNACRSELGLFPLRVNAKLRVVKFWVKFAISNKTKLSHLTIQDCNHANTPCSWSGKTKFIFDKLGYSFVWNQTFDETKSKIIVKQIKQRLEDIEIQAWFEEIHNDMGRKDSQKNKLRTYRTFKIIYKQENYLKGVSNIKHRIALTKLRISNHCLQIERGRHCRPYIKPEERICPLCDHGMEDEKHFLLKCPLFSPKRKELINKINKITNKKLEFLSEEEQFHVLINPNEKIQKTIGRYIYECFEERKEILTQTNT